MSKFIAESHIEQAALEILGGLGYETLFGPDIASDGKMPERVSYGDVVLIDRLKRMIDRLNPSIPNEAREEAIKQILRVESPNLIENNKNFHQYLVNGVTVEYRKGDRIKAIL